MSESISIDQLQQVLTDVLQRLQQLEQDVAQLKQN